MINVTQSLWDQMRAELQTDALPQLNNACQALLDGSLGPLTKQQIEDLQSVDRSIVKLNQRVNGDPINWNDYGEAAHALRGPLNSTIGFSRLILKGIDGPISDAQIQALEVIHTTGRRLLALFNLLLDALLLLEDNINPSLEAVQAGIIIEELVAVGHTLANHRGFVFETDLDTQVTQTTIQSDPKRLKQALSALLAVAAKYMSGEVMNLQARLWQNQLLIQLQNQACQLPPPLLADIPSLLTDRADFSTPYDAHLRLGLAWHLLTQMEGYLEAQQVDDTCTFTVSLPTG